MNGASPLGHLEFASSSSRSRLSRLATRGRAVRLSPGIYAVGAALPPEQLAHHHRFDIVAHLWSAAVISGPSGLRGGLPDHGVLHVVVPTGRRTALKLPALTIHPVDGPGPLPHDTPMPAGVFLAGPARCLVENVSVGAGRPARYRAGTRAVEDRIDREARSGGPGRIGTLLAQLDDIAHHFANDAVEAVRTRLRAVLESFAPEGMPVVASPLLTARLKGIPFDVHRMAALERLIEVVTSRPPHPRSAATSHQRWTWLPFFEAYFSNFIEGTEFGVDDARRIALEGMQIPGRHQDAHDVSATYRLASDPVDSVRVPTTGDELIDLVRHRHRLLMAARPEQRPGEFKLRPNFAGGYEFVRPELVVGTLLRGFALLSPVHDPLSRAVALMALITECHPFDDGNGRVSRLTANAELSAAAQVRIVVPTVFRNNYLAGLTAYSTGTGDGEPLIAVLDFAQRWTSAVDWGDYDSTIDQLEACHAFDDPVRAESSGRRLRLPPTTMTS